MTSLFKRGIKSVGSRHTSKEKLKAQFDITIRKLINSPDLNGTTKDVVVSNGEAQWNEKILIKGTLFRDQDTDKYDEKDVIFSLKVDSKVIAKHSVDLAQFTKNEHTYTEEVQLSKKPQCTLQITIHARWLKLNGKLLVKQEDNAPREKAGVEIDGQAYGLRTDDALTDTSIDTGTGSWEEEDNDMRDDPFTTTSMYEAESRKTHDEIEALRKQLRLVEGESAQRAKTIELQEKEIIDLRRQLEMIEKKCSESEELIQRGYELESFMHQQVALAQQEHKDELVLVKTNHQNEVDALHKELETMRTRAQLTELAPGHSAAPTSAAQLASTVESSEMQRLENEKIEMQGKVDSLEEEIQQSSLSLVNMTDNLAAKERRIESLTTQLHTLQLHADKLTSSLAVASSSVPTPSPSKNNTPSSTKRQPTKPLFANPLLDAHYKYITLLGFLILMSLYTLL